ASPASLLDILQGSPLPTAPTESPTPTMRETWNEARTAQPTAERACASSLQASPASLLDILQGSPWESFTAANEGPFGYQQDQVLEGPDEEDNWRENWRNHELAQLLLRPVAASLERLKGLEDPQWLQPFACKEAPWRQSLLEDLDVTCRCSLGEADLCGGQRQQQQEGELASTSPILHTDSNGDLGATSAGESAASCTTQATSPYEPVGLFSPALEGPGMDFGDETLLLTGALARLEGQLSALEAILAKVEAGGADDKVLGILASS
ncbi:unnamed protein product, partial [Polarella glacialis]